MLLNNKYSLFLTKFNEYVYIDLSRGTTINTGPNWHIFKFTKTGEFEASPGKAAITSALFALDSDGAVICDGDVVFDEFKAVRCDEPAETKMLTEDIGIRLIKSGANIKVAAVDAEGDCLENGSLLSFDPHGLVTRVWGVGGNFFNLDSKRRLALSNVNFVLGYKVTLEESKVKIGCKVFTKEELRRISSILKTTYITKAEIDLRLCRKLNVAGDLVHYGTERHYDRIVVADALAKLGLEK